MRKLSIYITILLISLSVSIAHLESITKRVLPSCVSICTYEPDGSYAVHGAGFFVAKNYVVTAKHVTDSISNINSPIYIHLADGTLVKVTKVIPLNTSKDVPIDAALLKAEARTSPPTKFGDSGHLAQGETVFAVGAPYGLEQSITVGIISALHRDYTIQETDYTDNIQTSGLVHPGNSGGALFDLRGRVIGVNVVGVGDNGGIGMAVPISQIETALRRVGIVTR